MSVLTALRLPVEAGKVAELARALRSPEDAVPPTFTVTAAHHSPPGESGNELVIRAAGLDPARVLLGQISWQYLTPIRVGEVLQGAVSYEGTERRQGQRGGQLTLAHGTTTWRDGGGEIRQLCRVTLIEPAGPPAALAEPETGQPQGEPFELSRTDIVRYAGASGDFNPVHHDEPYAQRAGYPRVFAMGLLPGGILGCQAGSDLAADGLTRLELRFSGLVWPDTVYRVSGEWLSEQGQRIRQLCLADGGRVLVRLRAFGGMTGKAGE